MANMAKIVHVFSCIVWIYWKRHRTLLSIYHGNESNFGLKYKLKLNQYDTIEKAAPNRHRQLIVRLTGWLHRNPKIKCAFRNIFFLRSTGACMCVCVVRTVPWPDERESIENIWSMLMLFMILFREINIFIYAMFSFVWKFQKCGKLHAHKVFQQIRKYEQQRELDRRKCVGFF